MKKLYYICQWGNNRKTAWSGTYLALFSRLQKKFDLIDYPISQSFSTKVRNALALRGFFKYDFSLSALRQSGRKVMGSIKDKNFCTFQYAELPTRKDAHNYMYLDMCADYIKNVIMKTPEFRDHYFRKNLNLKALDRRTALQNEFMINECAGIFTMSEWLADYLIKRVGVSPSKVHCVGAGVDIDVDRVNPHDRKGNKILFVGKSFEAKGGYVVVEAFKILRKKYLPNAELIIIGPSSNPLNEIVEGIHYKGLLPIDEVAEYYNVCDVFCMPSYIDAYGKVFIEALCSGLPCIGRNVFTMNEIIKDGINGYCIKDDDPDALALTMLNLLKDETIKQYVINHMDECRKEFTWEMVATKIEEVIGVDSFYNE